MLTEELWSALKPLVEQAKRYTCGQRPRVSERLFFEGLLYLARTGVPWRDLPGEFGAWDALYNRFRRWIASGSMTRLFELLTDNPDFDDVTRVLVDSTIIRAHRHAAGALQEKGARPSKVLGAAAAV
jgi:putative transposase